MSVLSVNTDQMNVDADGFTGISQLAGEISSYLRNSLALLGNFWGTDTVGSQFLAEWQPAINGLIETLSGLGDGMKSTALGIVDSAELYHKSNVVNSERI
jgi:hypothetical protein